MLWSGPSATNNVSLTEELTKEDGLDQMLWSGLKHHEPLWAEEWGAAATWFLPPDNLPLRYSSGDSTFKDGYSSFECAIAWLMTLTADIISFDVGKASQWSEI